MMDFYPEARFEIPGRGTVFTGPSPVAVGSVEGLIGRTVSIDGCAYRVLAVERIPMYASRPLLKGLSIGLLVNEVWPD